MNREEFLERRRHGIGASDVAAIMGLNPYKTAVGVYQEKVGLKPDEPTENMEWGKAFEQVIANRFASRAQLQIQWLGDITIVGQSEWMIAHPDFKIVKEPVGGEVKMTGPPTEEWGEEGTDQIPDYYLLQTQWQMAVTKWKAVHVTVLFSGYRREQRSYLVTEDLEIQSAMIDACGRFWVENVCAQVQPPLDWTEDSREYLRSRFPSAIADPREATAQEEQLAGEYARVAATFGALEKVKDTLANQLKQSIGDSKAIVGPGFKVTYTDYKESNFTVHKKAGRMMRCSGELFEEAKRVAGE